MNEESRSLCRAQVSRNMVQITYECRDQASLRAHASFDHRAALALNTNPSRTNTRAYGRRLYDLLLLADPKQNVSAVFSRCFHDPSSYVQMSIEIFDETLAELLQLSWEHLCDRDDRYLALESRFRLVRRLASLPLGRQPPSEGLPRVLVVISNPDNLEGFTVDALGPEGPQKQSFAPIEAPFQPQQTLGLAGLFDTLKAAGQIADKYLNTEWILVAMHLAGAVLLFLASKQDKFKPLFIVMMLYSLCYAATLPLVNSVLFAHISLARPPHECLCDPRG